jgi:hypothetical protein
LRSSDGLIHQSAFAKPAVGERRAWSERVGEGCLGLHVKQRYASSVYINDRESYLKLFADAPAAPVIGEGRPSYL